MINIWERIENSCRDEISDHAEMFKKQEEPDILGQAMNLWLEEKGLVSK